MKRRIRQFSGLVLILIASFCDAQTVRRWDFEKNNGQAVWAVPAPVGSALDGESLWIALPEDGAAANQILAVSPEELHIPAATANQVRLRVRNLSSLTDFYVRWKTLEKLWGYRILSPYELHAIVTAPTHSRRCTLKANQPEWQEVICHIDGRWEGMIDQIALISAHHAKIRGNIWIDRIEIVQGEPEPVRRPPDISSDRVVPKLTLPGVSQQGFQRAFQTLQAGMVVDVPLFGATHATMHPGGYWNVLGWTQFDTPPAAAGVQWASLPFAEEVMRGLFDVQAAHPDGHIPWISVYWEHGEAGTNVSLPVYFEAAYDVARRTPDVELREQIYRSMRAFLDWWLSPVKRHAGTGLITGYAEEALSDPTQSPHVTGGLSDLGPMQLAPVDLNVLVAVGADRVAALASVLRHTEEATRYRGVREDLARAINTYLWDEKKGAYYSYDVRTGERRTALIVSSTFDPLRLAMAPEPRRERLLQRLLDPAQFNWGKRPLTTWAMNEPGFIEADLIVGDGGWSGAIWSVRNLNVVRGLEESGRPDLAAELAWATINEFHNNYSECVIPSSRHGCGTGDYTPSAANYLRTIIEHLFGVDVDRIQKRIAITPHVPKALYGKSLALENLILPGYGETKVSVFIKQSNAQAAKISVRFSGPLPEASLRLTLPGGTKELTAPAQREFVARFP